MKKRILASLLLLCLMGGMLPTAHWRRNLTNNANNRTEIGKEQWGAR